MFRLKAKQYGDLKKTYLRMGPLSLQSRNYDASNIEMFNLVA